MTRAHLENRKFYEEEDEQGRNHLGTGIGIGGLEEEVVEVRQLFVEMRDFTTVYEKCLEFIESFPSQVERRSLVSATASASTSLLFPYFKYALLSSVELDRLPDCWMRIQKALLQYASSSNKESGGDDDDGTPDHHDQSVEIAIFSPRESAHLISLACFAFVKAGDFAGAREVVETWLVDGGVLNDSVVSCYIKALVGLEDFDYALDFCRVAYEFKEKSLQMVRVTLLLQILDNPPPTS